MAEGDLEQLMAEPGVLDNVLNNVVPPPNKLGLADINKAGINGQISNDAPLTETPQKVEVQEQDTEVLANQKKAAALRGNHAHPLTPIHPRAQQEGAEDFLDPGYADNLAAKGNNPAYLARSNPIQKPMPTQRLNIAAEQAQSGQAGITGQASTAATRPTTPVDPLAQLKDEDLGAGVLATFKDIQARFANSRIPSRPSTARPVEQENPEQDVPVRPASAPAAFADVGSIATSAIATPAAQPSLPEAATVTPMADAAREGILTAVLASPTPFLAATGALTQTLNLASSFVVEELPTLKPAISPVAEVQQQTVTEGQVVSPAVTTAAVSPAPTPAAVQQPPEAVIPSVVPVLEPAAPVVTTDANVNAAVTQTVADASPAPSPAAVQPLTADVVGATPSTTPSTTAVQQQPEAAITQAAPALETVAAAPASTGTPDANVTPAAAASQTVANLNTDRQLEPNVTDSTSAGEDVDEQSQWTSEAATMTTATYTIPTSDANVNTAATQTPSATPSPAATVATVAADTTATVTPGAEPIPALQPAAATVAATPVSSPTIPVTSDAIVNTAATQTPSAAASTTQTVAGVTAESRAQTPAAVQLDATIPSVVPAARRAERRAELYVVNERDGDDARTPEDNEVSRVNSPSGRKEPVNMYDINPAIDSDLEKQIAEQRAQQALEQEKQEAIAEALATDEFATGEVRSSSVQDWAILHPDSNRQNEQLQQQPSPASTMMQAPRVNQPTTKAQQQATSVTSDESQGLTDFNIEGSARGEFDQADHDVADRIAAEARQYQATIDENKRRVAKEDVLADEQESGLNPANTTTTRTSLRNALSNVDDDLQPANQQTQTQTAQVQKPQQPQQQTAGVPGANTQPPLQDISAGQNQEWGQPMVPQVKSAAERKADYAADRADAEWARRQKQDINRDHSGDDDNAREGLKDAVEAATIIAIGVMLLAAPVLAFLAVPALVYGSFKGAGALAELGLAGRGEYERQSQISEVDDIVRQSRAERGVGFEPGMVQGYGVANQAFVDPLQQQKINQIDGPSSFADAVIERAQASGIQDGDLAKVGIMAAVRKINFKDGMNDPAKNELIQGIVNQLNNGVPGPKDMNAFGKASRATIAEFENRFGPSFSVEVAGQNFISDTSKILKGLKEEDMVRQVAVWDNQLTLEGKAVPKVAASKSGIVLQEVRDSEIPNPQPGITQTPVVEVGKGSNANAQEGKDTGQGVDANPPAPTGNLNPVANSLAKLGRYAGYDNPEMPLRSPSPVTGRVASEVQTRAAQQVVGKDIDMSEAAAEATAQKGVNEKQAARG